MIGREHVVIEHIGCVVCVDDTPVNAWEAWFTIGPDPVRIGVATSRREATEMVRTHLATILGTPLPTETRPSRL